MTIMPSSTLHVCAFSSRPARAFRTIATPALALVALAFCVSTPALSAQSVEASTAAPSARVVPNVIRFSGTLTDGHGYPITSPIDATFSLYSQAASTQNAPLWQEKQRITPNENGAYTVYLGAATAKGLPAEIFTSVTAQYVGVKLDGEQELARVPLVSVPYALKASDAQTLGGLPASAFVLAGSQVGALVTGASASTITPDVTGVTTSGGTSNYLPKFTGASTVANSEVYDNGKNVGIGVVPNASVKLDVGGAMIMRGNMIVSRVGNATSSNGFPSYGFAFYSNVYNSSTHAADNPHFILQSEPIGNNTTNTSANFNLLYSNHGNAPVETGFYINPTGQIHFATGQTFPGAGDITGVTASSPLTGGGTSGNVTVGLSLSSLETSLNPEYARLAAANNFTSSATFGGPVTGVSGSTMYAIQGNTSSGYGVQGYATGTSGSGLYGYSTGNGGVGISGNATGGPNGANYPIGVQGHAIQGYGVKSIVDEPVTNFAAVLGLNGGGSGTYNAILGYDDLSAGVWADSEDTDNVIFPIGLVASADTSYAGYFQNNSPGLATVYAYNSNSGTVGTLFKTFQASSPDGTCGIGGGSLTCTGPVKSLATTADGERKVETYAMQSPENWMEDFGSGEVHGGSGTVTLDPVFAGTISASAGYHVFITPTGDSKGLYVTNKTATGFEVREAGGGTASIAFDYRIVAKRRGMETQRLTDVTERFAAETKTPLLARHQVVKK